MAWKKAQITKRELCFVENTLTFLPQQMLDIYDFYQCTNDWFVAMNRVPQNPVRKIIIYSVNYS